MSSDRNLLFGILAVQMNFISRDALIQAMNAWVLNKEISLGDILQRQNCLTADRAQLLEALVQEHLKTHDNDPQKSLAALSSAELMKEALLEVPDPEVQHSLQFIAKRLSPTVKDSKEALKGDETIASTRSFVSPESSSRFRILRPHAKGGLGEVFVAEDTELHREVALKEIQGKHAQNEVNRGRFILEAEVTGGLEHPNIVPVYGLGTYADGRPYYAMRFIRGDSLKEAIEKFHKTTFPNASDRNLAFRNLLKRFIDVCNAIAYAHSRGILHRDLKPGNIMLGKYGETLVVDWGLAKALGKSTRTDEYSTGERTLNPSGSSYAETIAGSAIGTPAFMSPEQAAGRLDQLGPASDVYSLGATLYVLLTGELPFKDNAFEILKKVESGDYPPPKQIRFDIPYALNATVLKAMAKQMENRYPTATALAEEIEHYLADEPVVAYREPFVERNRRWARKHPGIVAGLTATLLVGVLGLVVGSLMLSGKNQELGLANKLLDTALRDAKESESVAIARSFEKQREIERVQVANGLRLIDSGDYFSGMLWLASPLSATSLTTPASMHRYRLGLYWNVTSHPTLLQQFAPSEYIRRASYNSDGSLIVTVDSNDIVQVWNALSGQAVSPPLKHHNYVEVASFSPDGRLMVTGSNDGIARIWDVMRWKERLTIKQHKYKDVSKACFSPDSRMIATVSFSSVRIWDTENGNALTPSMDHSGQVDAVSYSPDGRCIVTACIDAVARIWDTKTGKMLSDRMKHEHWIQHTSYSPNGQLIITASYDNTARIWNASTGQLHCPPLTHVEGVRYAAFSTDSRRVVTASYDKTARVWDPASGRPITPPLQHRKRVFHACFSPDCRYVATASEDNTARVWDSSTGQEKTPPLIDQSRMTQVSFSPNGRHLLAVGNCARVWNIGNNMTNNEKTLKHKGAVYHSSFSPDGINVVTASHDGTAMLWNTATGTPLSKPLSHLFGRVNNAAYSPDGRNIVTSSTDNVGRIWDVSTGKMLSPLLLHKDNVRSASYSQDGRLIVTICDDRTANVWNTENRRLQSPVPHHHDKVIHACFSPDSLLLLTTSEDKTAQVWEISSGRQYCPPLQHDNTVNYATFSLDGGRIVTSSYDCTARIWDVKTGRAITPPLRHNDMVNYATFSPNGSRVVTASADNTARLWDATSGVATTPPLRHLDSVHGASFSHDGRRVATASIDSTARVWDSITGQELSPPFQHQGAVACATFSPDDRNLLTASLDNTARIWDVSLDSHLSKDWVRMVELINCIQVASNGVMTRIPQDKLDSLFHGLRSKYPADFSVTPEQARHWRLQQIADCCKEQNLSAALFHQNWLLAEAVVEAASKR